MSPIRTLLLVSLLAVTAHAQSAPPVFGTYANTTGSAAPEPTAPEFPGTLPVPGQPVPSSPTGAIPGALPAQPGGLPEGVPTAPTGSYPPNAIPVPIPGGMPGMPAMPGAAMPTDPAAMLSMLGVPYTISPDGRCATAQAGGYTINVCLDPNAAGPQGPGNTLPPAPPKGGTLAPVTVQSGDTLGELCQQAIDLALRLGLIAPPGPELWGAGGLVETVARHNAIENPNLIFPGQSFDFNVEQLGASGQPVPMPMPGLPQGVPPIAGAPAVPAPAVPTSGTGPIASAPGAGVQDAGFFLPAPPPLPNGVVPTLPPMPGE